MALPAIPEASAVAPTLHVFGVPLDGVQIMLATQAHVETCARAGIQLDYAGALLVAVDDAIRAALSPSDLPRSQHEEAQR